MHGPVKDHGRGHAPQSQRADEGGRLPMAMGHGCPAAFAAWRAAIAPRHLGRGTGLIDEYQPLRLQLGLGLEPRPPAAQNISPLLFAGERGFFERHAVAVEQPPDRALRDPEPMRVIQKLSDLRQGDVRPIRNQRQDLFAMRFDPVRALIPALWSRPDMTLTLPLIDPLDRRRRRNAEALRHRAARHAVVNRQYQPLSYVFRKRSRHAGWPPSPAYILNHISKVLGIPRDSVSSENALVV